MPQRPQLELKRRNVIRMGTNSRPDHQHPQGENGSQSVPERMGWIFTRIRSSDFLRNPARAMKPVLEKLQMLEIPPAGNSADTEDSVQNSHGVIDRVILRAEERRRN